MKQDDLLYKWDWQWGRGDDSDFFTVGAMFASCWPNCLLLTLTLVKRNRLPLMHLQISVVSVAVSRLNWIWKSK